MSTFQTSWHHIRRSPLQSFTAIFVMFVCFFVLTGFALISNGLSSVLNYFETKPEITIFLKDGIDRDSMENLRKELSNYPSIKEIKYISKEKALSIYKEQNKENPMLTEMVTSSILPASFEISVSDPKVLQQIADNLTSKKNTIDEVIYQKDIINSLMNWTDIVRKTGLAIVSVVCLITFLVTFMIIGMKVTNRKDEIKISRLLGASRFYVIRPFLYEGIFYGLVGSILGSLVFIGIAYYFKNSINNFFQPIEFLDNNLGLYLTIVSAEMLFGIFVGYISSWFSAKRYIKY